MDLVSIIIPYFKKKKYINKTIKSILNQTYKKFEIIIIYDDTSKKDLPYLKKLIKINKRIKLIVNKKNLGAGFSRNIGIKNSKGTYIGFIDADDTWKKNKLKLQLEFMKKNNYYFSHTSYSICDKNNHIVQSRKARNFLSYKSLLKSCDIGLSTVIIKKSILRKNNRFPKIKTKEDFVFWIKILKNKVKLYGLDINLTCWRKLDNSLSSSVVQKIKDGFLVYHRYLKINFFKSIYYLFLLSINSIIKRFF